MGRMPEYIRATTRQRPTARGSWQMVWPPARTSHAAAIAWIEEMPQVDDPEIFGMHENANTIYYRDCSRVLSHTQA